MTARVSSLLPIATLAALILAGPSITHAALCADSIDRSSPILSNGFASDLVNTRDNPSLIHSGNVAHLGLALAHAAVGTMEKRGAPAVTQQAVFFSAGLNIVAINRVSGCLYWSYIIPDRKSRLLGGNAVRSSALYYLNEGSPRPALVLAGDAFGYFYAVDAETGRLVWSRFLGTDPSHHQVTGAPQFYDGRLFVPISTKQVITALLDFLTPCCTSHGLLHAVDAYTGETSWIYHTAKHPTFEWSTLTFGPNGMSIWGTPAIDAARNSVYVGTGQNLTPPTTDNSDSIIAIDIDTGKKKWVFQATPNDAYNATCSLPPLDWKCVRPAGPDFDFGAPPILARTSDGVDAVVAGSKNGIVYSLNPTTGALNWSRKVGAGGKLGGIHWGMAVDPTRIYVAVSDVDVNKASAVPLVKGLYDPVVKQVTNATPGIYALDLKTGDVLWEAHPQHLHSRQFYDSIYSAALSVTNDVLFAGSLDGTVKALRTSDGVELWSYNTARKFTDVYGRQGRGGTIDSVGPIVAGGDVLVNSGYNTFGGANELSAGPGNALFIFRLAGH